MKKKKIEPQTIVMVLMIIVFVILLLVKPGLVTVVFKKSFVIINTLPVAEPEKAEDCRKLGGILILPEQDCAEDYISWGYGLINGEPRQCCIKDMCFLGSLKGEHATVYVSENKRFERRCVCPSPSSFNVQQGCIIAYR